jgi:DNA segregation ATPase FtsK/SpoIIIE, S-DNA-T family
MAGVLVKGSDFVEVQTKKEVKKDLYDKFWDKLKSIALRALDNLRPQNIKKTDLKKYLFSIPLNAYIVYLASQKLIFPWWMGGAFIAGGYFFEKAIHQEFSEKKNEAGKEQKEEIIVDESNRLTQVLQEFNFNPRLISRYTDDFAEHYVYILNAKVANVKSALIDIEKRCALLDNQLDVTFIRDTVKFSIQHEERRIFLIDELLADIEKPDKSKFEIPFLLGIDKQTGLPIIKDLVELYHVLIAGCTGSGKSVTTNSIIKSIMYWNHENVSWFITDFKRLEMPKYREFSNVMYFDTDEKSIKKMYRMVEAEYKRRIELLEKAKCENLQQYNSIKGVEKIPYLIVLTDEANGYKEFPSKVAEELESLRFKLVRMVRAVGIHFIETVQRVTDDEYSKAIRTQLPFKIVHKTDQSDIKNVIDNTAWAFKVSRLGKGDMIVHFAGDNYQELRACYGTKDDRIFILLKGAYEYESDRQNKRIPEKTEVW